MFIVREVLETDLNNLYDLSHQALLLNLPRDKGSLEKKIQESTNSFKNPNKSELNKNHFIFVLEDFLEKKVVGVSMIHGQHGTKEKPHFFLTVGEEKKYSQSLDKELNHQTLKFGYETSGYSEIGGLVLNNSYRGHPQKLGKLLSLSRFLFIKNNFELFTNIIHTELMPPLTSSGSSLLWEAVGRKFFNMEYWEADKLSQSNKEFILNLFPQGTIYTKLLPKEAVEMIGKVGPFTQPVKKMLEQIGFKYTNEVDPFDGGPHYRCRAKDIKVIKESFDSKISIGSLNDEFNSITSFKSNNQFICTYSNHQMTNNKNSTLVPKSLASLTKQDDHCSTYIL